MADDQLERILALEFEHVRPSRFIGEPRRVGVALASIPVIRSHDATSLKGTRKLSEVEHHVYFVFTL